MKSATLFLLASALVAGHDGGDGHDRDDWHGHNPPPVAAPEPATYAMMAVGLGVVIIAARKRERK